MSAEMSARVGPVVPPHPHRPWTPWNGALWFWPLKLETKVEVMESMRRMGLKFSRELLSEVEAEFWTQNIDDLLTKVYESKGLPYPEGEITICQFLRSDRRCVLGQN
jgi:hypothetical protein